MSVTTRETVRGLPARSLAEVKKPAFAVAGLADLWIEQVKDAPAAYAAEVRKASERLAEVPSAVRTLPGQVQSLRDGVQVRVDRATERAGVLYSSLAIRGQRVVTQIRRQPATEAAIVEGKEAVKKAEAAAVAARNSVRAGERAVVGAAATIG